MFERIMITRLVFLILIFQHEGLELEVEVVDKLLMFTSGALSFLSCSRRNC